MKRIKKILLVLVGVLCLTGCGVKDKNETKVLDYDQIFNNLSSSYTSFVKEDKELTEGMYQVDLSKFKSSMIVTSNGTATSKMYAIFELGEDSEASNDEFTYYVKIYKNYWTSQGEMYNADDLEIIKNGKTYNYGSYLIYIVNEDPETIYNLIIK